MTNDPLKPFWKHQNTIILDGGLATELERRGYDLDDALWSAKILRAAPHAIQQLHQDYLHAGADVVISASYQATLAGFRARGLDEPAAIDLLRRSVALAQAAREMFWQTAGASSGRLRPLIAASVGPYGAFLADGSEYSGAYGDITPAGLYDFHAARWHILAGCAPDLMACETMPRWDEVQVLAKLMEETAVPAWVTVTCQDGQTMSDGTPLAELAHFLDGVPQVVALGLNCVSPRIVREGIANLQAHTAKPLVVYPNSGEVYDAVQKGWRGEGEPEAFGSHGREWRKQGAMLVGGCCRTTPAHIVALATRLKQVGVSAVRPL